MSRERSSALSGIGLSQEDKEEIYRKTRDAAQHVIARKGAALESSVGVLRASLSHAH